MDYYNYGYDYSVTTGSTNGVFAALAAFSAVSMFISLGVSVLIIISLWKIFTKAGKPGWAAIVPIYNIIVLLEVVELPMWYIALFFIPFANIYAIFKIYIELAHKFGKSTGFGVAMVFFSVICLPILAFSKNAVYGGSAVQAQPAAPVQQPVQPVQASIPQQPVYNTNINQPASTQIQPEYTQNTSQPIYNNQPSTRICPNCGAQVDVNSKFCTVCGNQLN